MNRIITLFCGLLLLAIATGCQSARAMQDPQPKKEILCSEWDKSVSADKKAVVTPKK